MKVLLDIRDNRAEFVMELLGSLEFVKVKSITPEKAEVLQDLHVSVKNLNLVKKGKVKARPLRAVLD